MSLSRFSFLPVTIILSALLVVGFSSAASAQAPAAGEASRSASEFNVTRESLDNPLILIDTSMGEIVVELFPSEAPQTVSNFLGLAEGTKAFTDPDTGQQVQRPFYDGLIFHRVVEDFMIQGGSPTGRGDGTPGFSIPDEINARSLGLDRIPVIDEDGYPHSYLGVNTQQDFQREVLGPLYEEMGIDSQAELEERADEILERVNALNLMQLFQMQGYTYTENVLSRAPIAGVISMANAGPNSSGSQFFITTTDTPWLTGKFTIFGRVRQGMDVVEAISRVPTDDSSRPFSQVRINSIRRLQD